MSERRIRGESNFLIQRPARSYEPSSSRPARRRNSCNSHRPLEARSSGSYLATSVFTHAANPEAQPLRHKYEGVEMSKLGRLTALIGVLVLASGAPAFARGGRAGRVGGRRTRWAFPAVAGGCLEPRAVGALRVPP